MHTCIYSSNSSMTEVDNGNIGGRCQHCRAAPHYEVLIKELTRGIDWTRCPVPRKPWAKRRCAWLPPGPGPLAATWPSIATAIRAPSCGWPWPSAPADTPCAFCMVSSTAFGPGWPHRLCPSCVACLHHKPPTQAPSCDWQDRLSHQAAEAVRCALHRDGIDLTLTVVSPWLLCQDLALAGL